MTGFSEADWEQVALDTREVFGPNIDVYDLTRAVNDNATVPVFFEPSLAGFDPIEDVALPRKMD